MTSSPILAPGAEDFGASFARLLDVEELEQDYYRGIATPGGRGRAFGGQVIGQALSAATRTVDEARPAHSLHAYFIRPGDATKPILYVVSRDRDGGSFTTRRVVALQSGAPILNMSCSFQRVEEGMSHSALMPDVPGPDGLATEEELVAQYADLLPKGYAERRPHHRPIEIRHCSLRPPFTQESSEASFSFWFKSRGALPDGEALHRAALAFASDHGLLAVAMMPHGRSWIEPNMQVASLDHALWIHQPLRVDEWLLYHTDSPWAGGGRGFSRGQVFTQSGVHVADVAQEGLIRARG